jgi:hypothetical protein
LEQAHQDTAQVAPERAAMLRLARDHATTAEDLLDSSDDTPLAPILGLYREAIFLLAATDLAERRALVVAFETAPDSILAEAVQRDASLAQARHLLALHAALKVGDPVSGNPRALAHMTRAAVAAMLDRTETSRAGPLLCRRRRRLALAATLLALCLMASAKTVAYVFAPTDLAAGKPWSISSVLPDVYSAKILFHTNQEMNPWFEIDLGEVKLVRQLRVRNRSDGNWDRAIPLIAELGNDRVNWQVVATRETPFATWEPSFPATHARYVRLRVPRVSFLHLEEVKVF